MVGTLVGGCRCAMSWCHLDLTFDLVMTLTYKILSGLYLGNRKVKEVFFPHTFIYPFCTKFEAFGGVRVANPQSNALQCHRSYQV